MVQRKFHSTTAVCEILLPCFLFFYQEETGLSAPFRRTTLDGETQTSHDPEAGNAEMYEGCSNRAGTACKPSSLPLVWP